MQVTPYPKEWYPENAPQFLTVLRQFRQQVRYDLLTGALDPYGDANERRSGLQGIWDQLVAELQAQVES